MLSSKSGNAGFELQQVGYIFFTNNPGEVVINVNCSNLGNGHAAKSQKDLALPTV